MSTKICSYNIKWFENQFNSDNSLKSLGSSKKDKSLQKQRDGIIASLNAVRPDVLGIVEAPNSTTTTGAQSCEIKLKNFFSAMGWGHFKVLTGFISPGRQEIALAYDSTKYTAKHTPGGKAGSVKNPMFNEKFLFDTDDDRIKELYEFCRPPLEAELTETATGNILNIIVMHVKSKGVFTNVDLINLDRESIRNRKKIFAECSWARLRITEWQDQNKKVLVMGDINDGPGMDYYESQFGKSGIEMLLGDLFDNAHLLVHPGGRPKWGPYGWEPSSTRYKDPITGKQVNAQIDHIMISKNVSFEPNSYKIWNPSELDEAKDIKTELKAASDHYPITLNIEF